jgi:hypothetical protein
MLFNRLDKVHKVILGVAEEGRSQIQGQPGLHSKTLSQKNYDENEKV